MKSIAWLVLSVSALAWDDQVGRRTAADSTTATAADINAAREAPAEFAAAALIHVARSTPDPSGRAALLLEAYSLAEHAAEPFRRLNFGPVDAMEARRAEASALGFDRVTLQAAAAVELTKVDPALSRSRLLDISLTTPDLTCSDTTLSDLSPFYKAAAVIFKTAFDKADRENGAHVAFAQTVIAGVESSAHLQGAIRFVNEIWTDLDGTGRSTVMTALLRAFRDDRTVNPIAHFFLPDITTGVVSLGMKDAHARPELRTALRDYVRRYLTSESCARMLPRRAELVARVNAVLCPPNEECRLALDASRLRPSRVNNGRLALTPLWVDPRSLSFDRRIRALARRGPREEEWDFLVDSISAWRPDGDDRLRMAVEKAMLVNTAWPSLPSARLRSKALTVYADALADIEVASGRTPLWFKFARNLSGRIDAVAEADREFWRQRVTTDPVLSLFKQ